MPPRPISRTRRKSASARKSAISPGHWRSANNPDVKHQTVAASKEFLQLVGKFRMSGENAVPLRGLALFHLLHQGQENHVQRIVINGSGTHVYLGMGKKAATNAA